MLGQFEECFHKITSLHEVMAAGSPKQVGFDRGFDTIFKNERH